MTTIYMKYALIYRKNRGCTLPSIYSGLRCRNYKKVLCTDCVSITLKHRQASWQAQRNTGAESQVGIKIKDSEEGTPCQGPSQGCPRTATITILHAWKPSRWANETTALGLRGGCCQGVRGTVWDAREEHFGIAQDLWYAYGWKKR